MLDVLYKIHEKTIERNITVTMIIIEKIFKRLNINISNKKNEIGLYITAVIKNKTNNNSILNFMKKLKFINDKGDQSLIEHYIKKLNKTEMYNKKITKIDNVQDYCQVIKGLEKNNHNYKNLDVDFNMDQYKNFNRTSNKEKRYKILEEDYNLYLAQKKIYDYTLLEDIFPVILVVTKYFTGKIVVSEDMLKQYVKHLLCQLNVGILSLSYEELHLCREIGDIDSIIFNINCIELNYYINMKNKIFYLNDAHYTNVCKKFLDKNKNKYDKLPQRDKKFISNICYNNILLLEDNSIKPEKTWGEWFLEKGTNLFSILFAEYNKGYTLYKIHKQQQKKVEPNDIEFTGIKSISGLLLSS